MEKHPQNNTALERKLGAAIHLIKMGKNEESRKLIKEILATDPLYEPAWLWFADTFSDEEERLQILQMYVNKFPESQQAARVAKFIQKRRSELDQPIVEQPYVDNRQYEEKPEPELAAEEEPEFELEEERKFEPETKFEPEPLVFEEPDLKEDWLPEVIVEDFSRASRVVGEVLEEDHTEEDEVLPDAEVQLDNRDFEEEPFLSESAEAEFPSLEPSSPIELMSEETLLELLAQETKPEELWERKSEEPRTVFTETDLQEDGDAAFDEDIPGTHGKKSVFAEEKISEKSETAPFLETNETSATTEDEDEIIHWPAPFLEEEPEAGEPAEENKSSLFSKLSEDEDILFDFDLSAFSAAEPAESEPVPDENSQDENVENAKQQSSEQIWEEPFGEFDFSLESDFDSEMDMKTSADSENEKEPVSEPEEDHEKDTEKGLEFFFDISEEFQTEDSEIHSEAETAPAVLSVTKEDAAEKDKKFKALNGEELAGVSGLNAETFMEFREEASEVSNLEETLPVQGLKPVSEPELESEPERELKLESEPELEPEPELELESVQKSEPESAPEIESDLDEVFKAPIFQDEDLTSEVEDTPVIQEVEETENVPTGDMTETLGEEESEKQKEKVAEFERFLKKIRDENVQEGTGFGGQAGDVNEDIFSSLPDDSSFFDKSSPPSDSKSQDFFDDIFSDEDSTTQEETNFDESETLMALSGLLQERKSFDDEQTGENGNFFDDLAAINDDPEVYGLQEKKGFVENDFQKEVDEAFEDIGEIGLEEIEEDIAENDEHFQRWSEAEDELSGAKSSSADRTILVISILVILFTIILAIIWTVTRW